MLLINQGSLFQKKLADLVLFSNKKTTWKHFWPTTGAWPTTGPTTLCVLSKNRLGQIGRGEMGIPYRPILLTCMVKSDGERWVPLIDLYYWLVWRLPLKMPQYSWNLQKREISTRSDWPWCSIAAEKCLLYPCNARADFFFYFGGCFW